ncbi:MAG: Ku protein [Candidatus Krumholzibacteriia bacterium]
MPRAIWKGSISFGLLNVPVGVYPAEQRADLSFHLLDSRNHARVRYQRVNEETGEEVPWDQIIKGYEYDSGNYVLLGEEDFERVAVETTQTVEIQTFVERDEIDLTYFDKPYYLAPDRRGEKGYVLLRETLASTGKVGIAKVVIRTKQYLAALVPLGDALVLELMRFQQELRDPAELKLPSGKPADFKISPKELQMARTLVEAMSTAWDPSEYTDEYRERLMAYIDEKAANEGRVPATEAKAPPPPTKVVDMMEVLRRSLEEKQGGKKKAPAKKTGRKRAAG